MTWGEYLFSFRGRVNRARYWLFALVSAIGVLAAYAVLTPYMIFAARTAPAGPPVSPLSTVWGAATVIAVAAIAIALSIAGFAIYVKRLHDRNRSGWWLLFFIALPGVLNIVADINAPGDKPNAVALVCALAAAAIGIWAFVEFGCLRGTIGENRFGPDPLAPRL